MGSNDVILVVLAFIGVLFPAVVLSKTIIVGDEIGWGIWFDYEGWALDREFRVGDVLVFQYPVGFHNVFEVDEDGYQNCIKPPKNKALTSGNDKIELTTPGKKWFICGVDKHCEDGGQRLPIVVKPSTSSKPVLPAPKTPAPSLTPPKNSTISPALSPSKEPSTGTPDSPSPALGTTPSLSPSKEPSTANSATGMETVAYQAMALVAVATLAMAMV